MFFFENLNAVENFSCTCDDHCFDTEPTATNPKGETGCDS